MQITTAVLTAFLDNVSTVLLIAPVTLAICNTLRVPAYPYLVAEIFASNIGGTALRSSIIRSPRKVEEEPPENVRNALFGARKK